MLAEGQKSKGIISTQNLDQIPKQPASQTSTRNQLVETKQEERNDNPNEPNELGDSNQIQEEPNKSAKFRDIGELFEGIQREESEYEQSSQEDPNMESPFDLAEMQQNVETLPGEDDPDQGDEGDELTEEQQKLISKKILSSIRMFRKHYNLTENQYFMQKNTQNKLVEQSHTKAVAPPPEPKKLPPPPKIQMQPCLMQKTDT